VVDASKYSLDELLLLFEKDNKRVIELARRLSGIKAEIAQIKHELGHVEESKSRS
jgi:hypothetical protein